MKQKHHIPFHTSPFQKLYACAEPLSLPPLMRVGTLALHAAVPVSSSHLRLLRLAAAFVCVFDNSESLTNVTRHGVAVSAEATSSTIVSAPMAVLAAFVNGKL